MAQRDFPSEEAEMRLKMVSSKSHKEVFLQILVPSVSVTVKIRETRLQWSVCDNVSGYIELAAYLHLVPKPILQQRL